MIKYFLLLLNLLGVLLYRAFFTDGVHVTQNSPSAIKPGESFVLNMTIYKGSTGGFARMKQELPEGFRAVAVDVKGGDFIFLENDHAVKITWTSMPADSVFTISYQVIPGTVTGKFQLGGVFSYLEGNEKKSVELPVNDIDVGEEASQPTTAANPVSADQEAQKISPEEEPASASAAATEILAGVEISGARNVPSTIVAGDEFMVEVVIKKSSLKGFARFQDVLPPGCSATEANSRGGTFSFMDNAVKILWDNMPEGEELKVSYSITTDAIFTGNIILDGMFSYIENDEPAKYVLPASIISVTTNTSETAGKSTKTTAVPAPVPAAVKSTATDSKTSTETTDLSATAKEGQQASGVPSPDADISYKVQIAAGHAQVKNSYFSGKYSISENISTEMHEGWIKYVVGNFNVYKTARDHRQSIKEKGIQGPFVTAYNRGKRITVQEALMITSQQWYR